MRLAPFLLSLALLPATLTATAAGAAPAPDTGGDSAARQQRVRVTLAADAAWVRKGDAVTLSGKVRGTRGRTTVWIFQKKLRRGSSWNVEARKRTNRKGAFRHSEDILTGHRMYKACTRSRCSTTVTVRMGTPPPPPPPPTPPAQPTAVGLSSTSVATAEAGAPFTVTGTAVNLEGQTVQVQAYDVGSHSWGGVGSGVVAGGRWTASVAITTAGRAVPLRAYFPGASGLGASASAESPITVYGWYYFYDDGPLADVAGGWDDYGPATLNTTMFPRSVWLEPDAWSSDVGYAEFNLNRSCTTMVTTLGVSDNTSDTSRQFNVVIKGDSVTKYTRTGIGYAAPVPVTIDLTNVLRLRVEADQIAGQYYGWLAFGDARARCAF